MQYDYCHGSTSAVYVRVSPVARDQILSSFGAGDTKRTISVPI